MPFKSCIFVLADGARADLFEVNLKKGLMPNIARYMVEKGAYRTGTTVFPSTTGPAYIPFLTGCFPGPCNVPGIRWFNRHEYGKPGFSLKKFRSYVGVESFFINQDLHPDVQTLFEICDRPINIFSSINRGVGFSGNKSKLMRICYFYYGHLTDRWGFVDQSATRKLLDALKENPDFVFVVYPAIDEYAHLSNPFSLHTRNAYVELDRLLGEVIERLEADGKLDETLIMISSDHGLSTTSQHFGVDTFLEQKGLRTLFYPLIFRRNVEAATMVSGNGMCHVYFRGPNSWREPMPFESIEKHYRGILEEMLNRPEVDLLASRSENGQIVVFSRSGVARIEHNGHWAYHLKPNSGDPLGLKEFSDRRLSSEEALAATFHTDYPDSLVQLHQIFESSRSGDLIVTAKPGYDLRDRYESPEHKASHGSLHREHMHVPIVANVPLQEGPLRTADLFPTILSCLGRRPSFRVKLDGINRLKSV